MDSTTVLPGDSEIGKAKTLAQCMVGYAGLGAGLSAVTNPYFNSCPIGQSLPFTGTCADSHDATRAGILHAAYSLHRF